MTTQELVDARKRRIRLSVMGYDKTLKLSGKMSLKNILDKIDETTIPSCNGKEMEKYIDSLFNTTTAVLRFASTRNMRTNKRAYQWLQSEYNTQEVWASIRMYATLDYEVYTVSNDAMEYMNNSILSKSENKYKYLLFNKEHGFEAKEINIRVGDMLYSALVPSREASIKRGNSEIQLAVQFGDNNEPIATYSYYIRIEKFNADGTGLSGLEELNMICSNKQCPYHKASLSVEYADGSKRVDCTPQDCKKCKAFKNGVLSPLDLLLAVETVVYSYENKSQNNRVINNGAKVEYEPLPLPMREEPVVLYTDKLNDSETVIRVIDHNEDYIPGTHASPREHSRTEHMRYNPRTGKKDIHVSGCTVNKGYVKTTYEIKTHKHKKHSKEPEITAKGQSMINNLLNNEKGINK